MSAAQVAGLPRIVRFFGTTRSEDDTCPHCGATGSVVHHFQTEDGVRRGAMSGCVKLFPVSPIANEHLRLMKKQQEAAKAGRKLASWNVEALAAIDDYYEGRTTEGDALRVVSRAKGAARSFMVRRGWR